MPPPYCQHPVGREWALPLLIPGFGLKRQRRLLRTYANMRGNRFQSRTATNCPCRCDRWFSLSGISRTLRTAPFKRSAVPVVGSHSSRPLSCKPIGGGKVGVLTGPILRRGCGASVVREGRRLRGPLRSHRLMMTRHRHGHGLPVQRRHSIGSQQVSIKASGIGRRTIGSGVGLLGGSGDRGRSTPVRTIEPIALPPTPRHSCRAACEIQAVGRRNPGKGSAGHGFMAGWHVRMSNR